MQRRGVKHLLQSGLLAAIGFASTMVPASLFAAPAATANAEPAPSFWVDATLDEMLVDDVSQINLPSRYRSAMIDTWETRQLLASAPMRFSPEAESAPLVISLPMPDGTNARFEVVEAPVVEADLALLHPDIKTYSGTGVDDPSARVRMDIGPNGFHAMIRSEAGTIMIDPLQQGESQRYVSYLKKDRAPRRDTTWKCLTEEIDGNGRPLPPDETIPRSGGSRASLFGTQLRTYRIAIATTAEYTIQKGGATAALNAVVTSVNRLNLLYEDDLSINFTLVGNTNLLIETVAASDPYNNTASSAQIDIMENTANTRIGQANYDVTHLFTTDPGGGIAGGIGNVCLNANEGGATGLAEPDDDWYDIDYVAHELGHQFGGRHTMSGCNVDAGINSCEIGSGTTIMGYAGVCGPPYDYEVHSDPQFHSVSIEQIVTYIAGTGACMVNSANGNAAPNVNGGADFAIPISTPFTLTAVGSDGDVGDTLYYSWEQRDNVAVAVDFMGADDGSRPLFRIQPLTTSPSRTFPALSTIIANATDLTETLPTVSRAAMDFTVAVRDLKGGVGTDQVALNVVGAAGPFLVTSFNSATLLTSTSQTVTWNIAGTTAAPINAANVKISLSTDGGLTFPTTLLASTPNDGTEGVTLPAITASSCRFKVEAVGNIFWDMSNADVAIATAGVPMLSAGSPSAAEGNSGTSTLGFTVSLNTPNPGPGNITVNYATADGTAASGLDYLATSGSLTFLPSESSKPVNVTVYGEVDAEASETVLLNLSNEAGTVGVYQRTGTGTITNDDYPRRAYAVSTESGISGSTANMEGCYPFDPSDVAGTVGYSISSSIVGFQNANTYVCGGDFAGTDNTVFYAMTSSATQFQLHLIDPLTGLVTASRTAQTLPAGHRLSGLRWEPAGTRMLALFTDTLGNTAGQRGLRIDVVNLATGALGTNVRTFTGSVPGNAGGTQRGWGFAIHPTTGLYYTMFSSGNYTTGATGTTVVYRIDAAAVVSLGGGLTAVANYNGDLAFDPLTSTLYASAYDANFLNNLYSVNVTTGAFTGIVNLDGALPTGYSTTSAIGFPQIAAGTPRMSVNDPTAVTEGNSGTTNLTFTVSLDVVNPGPGNVTADWYLSDTINGLDITPSSGTVTFVPTDNSESVVLAVQGDTTWELNEHVQLNLHHPSSNVLISDTAGVSRINNDDGFVPAGYAFGIDIALDGLVAFDPANVAGTFTRSIDTTFNQNFAGGDFNANDRTTFYAFQVSTNQLVSVNTSTGAMTTIGAITGIPTTPAAHSVRGMGYDANAGVMRSMTRIFGSTSGASQQVNLATGALTGSVAFNGVTDTVGLFGITFPPTSSTGYMIDVDAEYVNREGLVSIVPTTGVTARIGTDPGYDDVFAGVHDLDYSPITGITRAGFDADQVHTLYKVNSSTGVHTELATLEDYNAFQIAAMGIAGPGGPIITNVTSSLGSGLYGTGQLVPIQVTFSTAVDVTGFPQLTLNTTPVNRVVNYSGGTGTNTLTFNYTVIAGDATSDLDYLSVGALALNGGTINQTGAGPSAILSLPAPGATGSLGFNRDIVIDTIAPTVTSITRVNSTPTNAATVQYTINFSEPVNGVASGNLAQTVTSGSFSVAPSFNSISGANGTATRTVTVNTGTNNGASADFRLDLANASPAITDAAGNPLSVTFNTGQVYTVDKTAPTVSSINRVNASPTNSATVDYTVTFSEAVNGVASGNFAHTVTSGTFSVAPSFNAISGANGTATRTVTSNTGTNNAPSADFRLDLSSTSPSITDLAGNALAATFNTGQAYTVDKTGPTVSSINRVNTTPTNAATVQYTITFSENVNGVASGNLAHTVTSGTFSVAPSFNAISGANGTATRTVTSNTGTPNGASADFRLDLANATPSITDALGNALVTTFNTGQTYTVDKVAPTVSSINRVNASPTNSATVDYTVTFSEAVNGVASGNFAHTVTSGTFSVAPSFNAIAGANGTSTRTVTSNTGTNNGASADFRLDLSSATPSITDLAGNSLSATFNSGQAYTVDKTGPTVSSINRVNTTPTNAATVQYTITFSEAVNGVASGNLAHTVTSGTFSVAPSFNAISGANGTATRTVTSNTGTNNGASADFRLDLSSATPSITDTLGNALVTTFNTGQTYTVDKTAPTVSSIVRASGNPTSAATVDYTVTFSEAVNGAASGNFAHTVTSGTFSVAPSFNAIAGANGTATRTVTSNTGTNNGASADFRLDLSSATPSITDLAGNTLSATFNTGEAYTVDKSAPTVVSINRVNATPTNAATVQYTITFSEAVNGVASGNLAHTVTSGTFSVAPSFNAISGANGTSTRTVTCNTGTNNGASANFRLDLSSASPSITDLSGNALTATFNSGQEYTVDKTVPTVSSIVRVNGTPTNAATVQYTVTFSEAVNGVASGNLAQTVTSGTFSVAPSFNAISGANGTATRTVTVNTGTNNGASADFRLDLSSATPAITDNAGNSLSATFNTGEVYTVDKTAPTVSSINRVNASPTGAATVDYTVTFSEAVNGVASGNFAHTVTSGTFSVAPSFNAIAGANGTATRTVTSNTGTNNGASADFRLDLSSTSPSITDLAGNTLSATFNTGQAYTVDKSVPTVVSINRVNATPTNAATVDYTVTFSESVSGVASGNFSFAVPAGSFAVAPSVNNITGSGSSRTVTINTGTNDPLNATLRLDLSSTSPAITDTVGNTLAATFSSGQTYVVDKTGPSVSSITRNNASPTNSASVGYTVAFDEAVNGVAAGNFSLANPNGSFSVSPSLGAITGSNGTASRVVNVNTGTNNPPDADFRLDLSSASPSITDALGNPLSVTFNSGQVYTVDKSGPTVTINQGGSQSDPTNVNPVVFDVAFSEPVTGFSNTDVSTAGSTAGGPFTITVLGGPQDYTVEISGISSNGNVQAAINANAAIDTLGNNSAASTSTDNVVTFDNTALTVTINKAGGQGDPTNASPILFTAVFNKPVLGFATGDVDLTSSTTGGTLSGVVSGGPVTFTVTVSGMAGSGDVIAEIQPGVCTDALAVPNAASTSTDNIVAYDVTAPTVTSIVRADSNPSNLSSVDFTVTFSEDVTGGAGSNFSLTTAGVSGPSIGVVSGTADTRNVAVGTGTGDGTIRLNMANSTGVTDLAGNAVTGLPFNTGEVYTIDKTAPAVSSITRDDANPTNATTVDYTVTFTEPVNGVTAPGNLQAFVAGGTFGVNPFATGISGSDGTATRTVTVNTGMPSPPSADLRLSLTSLTPTITDMAGNALTSTFTTGEIYTVDKQVPVVMSINRVNTTPTSAATVQYTITFGEPVNGVASGNLAQTVTSGTFSAAPSFNSISGANGTSTRTVTVNTGTNNGASADFRLDLSSVTPAITDLAGNALTGTFATGQTYTVDKTVPTVVSINRVNTTPTNAATVDYTVTFSEAVNGVASGNLAQTVTSGTFSVAPSFNAIAGANGTSTRTVTVNTGTNNGASADFRLDLSNLAPAITDTAGNAVAATFNTGEAYTVDKTAPTVASILRASTNPTNAATVDFTVNFSEAVNGAAAGNFSTTVTSGTFSVAPSYSSIAGSDGTSSRTVTANTGTNNGASASFRLDLSSASPSITDLAGNTLSVTFNTGQVYSVDKNTPDVVSIVRVNATPTNAATVDYTVTFSESVTGVASGNFSFAVTSGSFAVAPSISGITGTGTTRTVTINTGTNDPPSATLRLDLSLLSPAITDTAGNTLAATFATGQTYTVDKTGPTVSSITRNNTTPTNAASVAYTVTFDETVNGVAAGNFSLANPSGTFSVAPTLGAITGTNGTATRTVNVNTGTNNPQSADFRLDLSSATPSITDTLGNALVTTFNSGQVYTVDKTSPSVTINQGGTQSDPTNLSPIVFDVAFSESVSGFSNADISTTGSTAGGPFTIAVLGGPQNYTVEVTGMSSTGTVQAAVNTSAAIDTAGNNSGASTSTDNVVTYDTTALTCTIEQAVGQVDPDNTSPITFTVLFNKNVADFATGDVSFAGSTAGGTLVGTVTGSLNSYTVTVTGMTTSGNVVASINAGVAHDSLANPNAASTSVDNTVTWDVITPTVVSIVRAEANPTNQSAVDFTVNFSESVVGGSSSNFSLTTTGVSGASVGTVSGTGNTRTVTVNTGTGDGTIRLNMANSTGVADAATNAVSSLPFNGGQIYTIDKTAPTVSSITLLDPATTALQTVQFSVTLSEATSAMALGNFSLTEGGSVTGSSVLSVSGSGPFTVSVDTGSGDGTLRLDVTSAGTVADPATNPLTALPFSTGPAYTIDKNTDVLDWSLLEN